MANITRTIRIRAGRRLLGQLLRLLLCTLNLAILTTGIYFGNPGLIITGALLLTIMIVVRLGRSSITIALNSGGIAFSLLSWKRYFPWENIRSAGVYVIRNG